MTYLTKHIQLDCQYQRRTKQTRYYLIYHNDPDAHLPTDTELVKMVYEETGFVPTFGDWVKFNSTDIWMRQVLVNGFSKSEVG